MTGGREGGRKEGGKQGRKKMHKDNLEIPDTPQFLFFSGGERFTRCIPIVERNIEYPDVTMKHGVRRLLGA